MQVDLVLTNLTPLCFRQSRSDKGVDTLDYIPGAALLGGLAAAHCRLGRNKQEFEQFFTSGQIRFGNLYPANYEAEELRGHSLPVYRLPATARSCKRFEGFLFNAEKDDEDRHGVSDHLIPWALFALSGHQAVEVLNTGEKCGYQKNGKVCDVPVSAINKFYRRRLDSKAYGIAKSSPRLITRVGISRYRGAASEGILYNRQVLAENQNFWGKLQFENKFLWQDFSNFLETAFDAELIYLGNNRSRGLGKVSKVLVEEIEAPYDTPEQLQEHVLAFTNKLKEKAVHHNIEVSYSLFIPVTLQSDLILRDSLRRYQSALPPDCLKLQGLKLIYHSAGMHRVMGWNAALGLPKPDDFAIDIGSVFLFGYNGTTDASFWQTLYDLQCTGIGERRREGFGEIMIADSFHIPTEVERL